MPVIDGTGVEGSFSRVEINLGKIYHKKETVYSSIVEKSERVSPDAAVCGSSRCKATGPRCRRRVRPCLRRGSQPALL